MLKVLKLYIPLFVWLVVAGYALAPNPARAADDREPQLEAKLVVARILLAQEQWGELARLPLPARASEIWRAHPELECELLFARGLGAARAGFQAMAWYSLERLGESGCACEEELRRELDLARYLNR